MKKFVVLLVMVAFISTIAQSAIISSFRDDFNGSGALGVGWQPVEKTFAGDFAIQENGYLRMSGMAGSKMFLTTDTLWTPDQDEYIKITARISGGLDGFANGMAFSHSTRASELQHADGYRSEGVGAYTWADGWYDLESIMYTTVNGREFVQVDDARGQLYDFMSDELWYLIEMTDDGSTMTYSVTDEISGDSFTVSHDFSPWTGLSSFVGFGIDARGPAVFPTAPAQAEMLWDYFQVDIISTAIPEPATLLLLGLGTFLLKRKRS